MVSVPEPLSVTLPLSNNSVVLPPEAKLMFPVLVMVPIKLVTPLLST